MQVMFCSFWGPETKDYLLSGSCYWSWRAAVSPARKVTVLQRRISQLLGVLFYLMPPFLC